MYTPDRIETPPEPYDYYCDYHDIYYDDYCPECEHENQIENDRD